VNKQTQEILFSSDSDDWATPQHFFDLLNEEFGPFTLDPCANQSNYKTPLYFTASENGLEQSWKGDNVFMNPPYGRKIGDWIKKAYDESRQPDTQVTILIPARTDTKYWHNYVMKASELYFVKGRLKFGNGDGSAPFPSAVAIFRAEITPLEVGTIEP